MRTFLIAAATAASALAVAAPASAQYYPQPRGNAYGYDNYGHVRSLQARVNQLQRRIERLDGRDRISEREARNLRADARDLERRLFVASRNGLNPREFAFIDQRVQRLEYRLMRDARDGNRRNDRRWDNDGRWSDRDRDGRNDRFEDDRGRYPG